MFKITTSKEAVRDSSGGNYISDNGIYDVTIKFASVGVSKNGAQSINFNVDYKGNSQTFYGPFVTDKNDQPLEIGVNLINKLGIIAGLGEGDELSAETETHKVGKDQKEMEFTVIPEFSDLPVKMRVQLEYSSYNDDITERFVIRNFFREDGASAQEIVDGAEEVGKQYALELEKYSSNSSYKDGLTEEDVAAWKEAKASGKETTKAKVSTNASARKATLFKKAG